MGQNRGLTLRTLGMIFAVGTLNIPNTLSPLGLGAMACSDESGFRVQGLGFRV